jgi:lysophospholipase L1-like esterase
VAVDFATGQTQFGIADLVGAVTFPAPAERPLGVVAVDCATGRQRTSVFDAVVAAGQRAVVSLEDPMPAAWYRTQSSTAPRNVVLIGDSITEGYFIPDAANWWVAAVQRALGDDAGGYYPVAHNAWLPPFPNDPWTTSGGTFASIGGLASQAWTLTAGSSARARFAGDTISVLFTRAPGGGVAEVRIDGARVATVNTDAIALSSGDRVDLTGLGPGPHTVDVSVRTVGSAGVTVEGVLTGGGERTTIWEAGRAGSDVLSWVTNAASWRGSLQAAHPDLVLIDLGTNDLEQVTAPYFEWYLYLLIGQVHEVAPAAAIGLVVPIGIAGREADFAPYQAAVRRLASLTGSGIVDLDLRRRILGTSIADLTVDGIHPNAAGSSLIASAVIDALRAAG